MISNEAIVYHFIAPGQHRNKLILGGTLNCIYVYLKRTSLLKYYFLPFIYLATRKDANKWLSDDGTIEFGFKKLVSDFFENNLWFKLPLVIYLLIVEIPIRAKIKNAIEERYFKYGK